MSKQCKCVKITADGTMTEIINHKEDQDWKEMRGWDARSLPLAEKWGFRLSIIMQDYFEETDPENQTASMIYHTLKHAGFSAEVLRGTVFIFNEDLEGEIDFTKEELNEVVFKSCLWRSMCNK